MVQMNVLIVDDNHLLCMSLGRMLSRMKLHHRAVEDGASAMEEIRSTFYDLVFLDIRLPDANGLDLMKEFRRISPETKIVVFSSDGSERNVKRAFSEGALRFLHKPFDCLEVEEALESALPGPRCRPAGPDAKDSSIPARISGSGIEGTDT